MSDLISRSALIEKLEEYIEYNTFDIYQEEPLINIGFGQLEDIIYKQPTVEARPSGKWIKSETGVFICSKCNNGYKNQPTCMGYPMFEFCPMCGSKMNGADMRGGKND